MEAAGPPPPAPGRAKTARFFCRFSSRLVLRSSMMLSSRLRRASSASRPFLKPFLRRSARASPPPAVHAAGGGGGGGRGGGGPGRRGGAGRARGRGGAVLPLPPAPPHRPSPPLPLRLLFRLLLLPPPPLRGFPFRCPRNISCRYPCYMLCVIHPDRPGRPPAPPPPGGPISHPLYTAVIPILCCVLCIQIGPGKPPGRPRAPAPPPLPAPPPALGDGRDFLGFRKMLCHMSSLITARTKSSRTRVQHLAESSGLWAP